MKALKLTALFALATFAIVACSKKDDAPATPTYAGSLTYEGTTYQIDKGFFATEYNSDLQADLGYYAFSNATDVNNPDTTKPGNVVYFTNIQKTVVPGTYTYKDTGTVSTATNFVFGQVILNAFTANRVNVLATYGSKVTIATAGDNQYKIDYDFIVTGNKNIKGTYTGKLATW